MDIKDILLDYRDNKKSLEEVIDSLSLFSIEHIEDQVAQIDINRANRKHVPEVVLATHKKPRDLLLILNKILQKNEYVLVSKIKPSLVPKLVYYYRKTGFIIDEGRNSTSILIYKNESSHIKISILNISEIDISNNLINKSKSSKIKISVLNISDYFKICENKFEKYWFITKKSSDITSETFQINFNKFKIGAYITSNKNLEYYRQKAVYFGATRYLDDETLVMIATSEKLLDKYKYYFNKYDLIRIIDIRV